MKVWATACDSRLGINPMVSRLFHAIPGIHLQQYLTPDTDAIFLSWIASPDIYSEDKAAIRAIFDSKKPVIIFDSMETCPPNCILGIDKCCEQLRAYSDLFLSASKMNIVAYFKRELISNFALPDTKFPVFPLDWTLNFK